MMFILLCSCLVLVPSVSGTTVPVQYSTCGKHFDLDDYGNELEFTYEGSSIKNPCRLKMIHYGWDESVCVKITEEGSQCRVNVEYHSSLYTSRPDRSISCGSSNMFDEYCTSTRTLEVVLKTDYNMPWKPPLKLKVYIKDTSTRNTVEKVQAIVKTSVYVVVGVIVACIVIVIIVVVVIILCCCRRGRTSGGTVYRSPQMAAATATSQVHYPPAQQVAYPPQQFPQPQGYPPPQAGYQPQPYTQQTGYPPAPQQANVGYQMAPLPGSQPSPAVEKPTMASAPPITEMYPMQPVPPAAPPPYPGN